MPVPGPVLDPGVKEEEVDAEPEPEPEPEVVVVGQAPLVGVVAVLLESAIFSLSWHKSDTLQHTR